jgi:hypothetical protein
MLKVPMDVAPEQFSFLPLLLIVLGALVAMVVVVLWLRYTRKDK